VRRTLLLALTALALLAGCGGDDDGGEGIVFKDPKGTINVERDMTFTLELSVNAGVGFDWEPVARPTGIALVELKDTKVDYPDEQREGDSGVKRFVYEAKRTGRQTIVLRHLFRGDEKERRTITVVIGG
jgi:predicted secreted protein